MANAFSAEIMAAQGYDSVTIDLQHGIADYKTAVGMFQAMDATGITPMARVPWLDPAEVMKILDAGEMGVICPMINTREEAERLVSCVKYPSPLSQKLRSYARSFQRVPIMDPSRRSKLACPGVGCRHDGSPESRVHQVFPLRQLSLDA
ncbi:aldolase/citrate lyase family protein [Rhizobium sp. 2YAF20]|uniref:aldolase/citrate lyase family protein n=1 Tax=Rhizobium sp. 2YAF20 TaxID=3233027 RepID=UPI003F9820C7